MQVEIGKWGNSMALRIPAIMAKESGLKVGSSAELTVKDGVLIITPRTKMTRKERYQRILADLEKYGRDEWIDPGPAVGNEIAEW